MKLVGFLLGFLGGLTFLWRTITIDPGVEIGILLALVGTFAWGAYTITLHYLEGVNRYVVITVTLAASSLLLLSFVTMMFVQGVELVLIIDAFSVTGLLISGVLGSGIAYVLYFTAVEILGAARASSFQFLIPFVSVAGDFALGEPPELVILLAGLIAIVGVGLVRLSDSDERATE
jgi:drug/metabolite transporter (DMT)-like permease